MQTVNQKYIGWGGIIQQMSLNFLSFADLLKYSNPDK